MEIFLYFESRSGEKLDSLIYSNIFIQMQKKNIFFLSTCKYVTTIISASEVLFSCA